VQATLLGVSIAIILALVTALVGPFFIDWSQYRAVFEAEASRLVGAPVRVLGDIDARIVPTPSVMLRGIEIVRKSGGEPMRARELTFELGLGPLMRGQLRATDLRLVGPEIALGLDGAGRLDWSVTGAGLDPDQLSIEHFAIEDGRAVLSDARSGARVAVEKLWFNGELRSLVGPLKGEGGFSVEGARYGYRIAAARLADDGTMKLRLALDPTDGPVSFEGDGTLGFDRGQPRFDGALTVARPAGLVLPTGRGVASMPWQATARVTATPANALIEQLEFRYGPEERALKLTGAAELKLGRSPRLDGVISGRELDLDRTLDLPEGARRLPAAAIRSIAETLGDALALPIPARLGIGIDNITLAGGAVQAVHGDLKNDADGWDLETLEFRAPGFAQVRVSGRLGVGTRGLTFKGPATVEASAPQALVAWLEGRSDLRTAQAGSLRASGDITLGSDRVGVDRLKAEIDRRSIEGRLAYAFAAESRPARLEAELTAAQIDLDQAAAFAGAAFSGTSLELPGEMALAIDIGQATLGGIEARNASIRLKLDARTLVLERVAVADLGGGAVALEGRIEEPLKAPRGALSLDVDARALDGAVALISRLVPSAGATLRRVATPLSPLKLHAGVTIDSTPQARAGTARLAIEGTAGVTRVRLSAEASGDPFVPGSLETRLDGQLAADDGSTLVALLGLNQAVAVDKRPATLSLAARGPAVGDLRVDARLNAGGLALSTNGTLRLGAESGVAAGLDLSLSADDAGALRPAGTGRRDKLPVTLRTRLSGAGQQFTLDNLSGTVAGTPLRGKLSVTLASSLRLDGSLNSDSVDASALLGAAAGMPPAAAGRSDAAGVSSEPFTRGLLDGLTGQIEVSSQRAGLTPSLIARQLRARLRLADSGFELEDIEAGLAGGRLAGDLALRRSPQGLALQARLALTDVDPTLLLPSEGRAPVTGKLAVQLQVDGAGLSPAALVGSLNGSGTITLDGGQLAALDPKVFETLTRAVDQGLAPDAPRIRDLVSAGLDSGSLPVARADGALSVVAGQLRLANTIMRGSGADLAVAGTTDLVAGAIEARLTLSGAVPAESNAVGRPDIFILLRGPLAAPRRSIDVSALSGWLTLRAVDRETRRIEAIESDGKDQPVGASPSAVMRAPTAPGRAGVATGQAPAAGSAGTGQTVGAAPAGAPASAPSAGRGLLPPEVQSPARPIIVPARPEASVAPAAAPTVQGGAQGGDSVRGDPALAPLPPPIDIRPPAGAAPARRTAPRTSDGPRQDAARPPTEIPTASPSRSILDQLFRPQR
jgi:uncharacterized protein involved in outer membrane biogenesis